MADLVYQFGRTVLEGMFRENLLGLPLWRYDHTRVSGPWLVAGIEWFRPRLGGCVDLLLLYAVTSITIVVTSKTIYLFLF